jgi:hypothetical protein
MAGTIARCARKILQAKHDARLRDGAVDRRRAVRRGRGTATACTGIHQFPHDLSAPV